MSTESEPFLDIRADLRPEDHTILTARGEIDLATAPELERRLTEALTRDMPVIVDLTEVGYMDSSAFRSFHRAAALGTLILVIPPEAFTRRVIDLAGLGGLMAICDDMADATERAHGTPK